MIINYAIVQCESYMVFPVSFTSRYKIVGTLRGNGAQGALCCGHDSLSQTKFYCITYDGKHWTDWVEAICIGF